MQDFWLQQGVMGAVILGLGVAVGVLFNALAKANEDKAQMLKDNISTLKELTTAITAWRDSLNIADEIRKLGERGK